ncbi:MAG: AAA family ATPase [Clostridiales bacterium]|nr:AAA family ATPase [Clostridiales bacterium]
MYQSRHTGELLDLLYECGASMQILAGRNKGLVLISVSGDMPLRLRSQLTSYFCGFRPVPLSKLAKDDLATDNTFLGLFVWNLLTELGERTGKYLDPGLIEDDLDDDLFMDDGSDLETDLYSDESGADMKDKASLENVTIEEMEFSVRTYNCLKRAGINTAEQLSRMTGSDIRAVRLIGNKGFEEVVKKLKDMFGIDPAAAEKKDYLGQLESLAGLEDVKEQVRRIVAFARMKKAFADNGKDDLSIALNMSFLGNPGTAKTTVARILAGIFYEIGLTRYDDVVEVGRAGLVGEYVGKTALKVESVFERAKGKVLFIDEAYSLADSYSNSFGDEAINTLVQQMENNRMDTVVIFAGYPDKMESFLSRNPGLRSRIPFSVEFKDYDVDTLVRIAEIKASDYGFGITAEAKGKINALCKEAVKISEFGNGRFCRNLVENALIQFAARNFEGECDTVPEALLDAEDFSLPLNLKKPEPAKKFGFV